MLTPRIDRLERLRALVASKPADVVDLSDWESACGAIFCAVGWATQDPSFQAEGLAFRLHVGEFRAGPSFDGHTHWAAVQAFFGLTRGQGDYLFMPQRTHSEYCANERLDADPPGLSDKDAVLLRLDTFIRNVRESEHA